MVLNKKYLIPIVATLIGFGAIGLFAALFHRPIAKQSPATTTAAATTASNAATAASATPATPNSLPTDQNQLQQQQSTGTNVSPSVVQGTRSPTADKQPLGAVQSFQPPPAGTSGTKLWEAPPYALAANNGQSSQGAQNSNVASARLSQVAKPSLVFVLTAAEGPGAAHLAPEHEEPTINNLGYQPGDHIATHLEAVATTATKAPVIAVVDYNYQRHGITIIPAGTRIIGMIGQASSTGIMDIKFSSLHLPNGEDVPISAIGLNTQMGALKGIVTGKNIGKQILLAALSGLGATTALFAGNSNVTGTVSEGDMIRAQGAQNMGQAADSQIGQLSVSQHLVVTAPAGTQVEVTFTAPAKLKPPTVM
jgi:hypothetical protein